MGLDMFLTKKTYVRSWDDDTGYKVFVTYNGQSTDINPDKVTYVVEEIGYWRKANAIHKWFVDNVQGGKDDCGEYFVNREKIEKLMNLCQEVLDKPGSGVMLLPTVEGSFFGTSSYGDRYLDVLHQTIKVCQAALNSDERATFYYQSSW